jgi:hypothetical protein
MTVLAEGVAHAIAATVAVFFLVLGSVNLLRTLAAERNDALGDDPTDPAAAIDSAGKFVVANALFIGVGVGLMVAFTFLR